MSKTVCIYHSIDLDGWMSAAIVKHWFDSINDYPDSISKGTIDFLGYNYGQPVPDLSEYDKVIMCDISFSVDEMFKIERKLSENFIWIDHHISAIKDIHDKGFCADGIRNIKFAACELTWKYFFPNVEMPEIVRLLGRYDCFGHKGTEEEKKVLEFQYGARSVIVGYEQCYNLLCSWSGNESQRCAHEGQIHMIKTKGAGIFEYLCTEAKQAYQNGFEIYLDEEILDGSLDGLKIHSNNKVYRERKFICANKERFNPINFGIEYHKDGYDGAACFHRTKDGKWAFSLYNDNGLVDVSVIAKQFGGGGHKGAAGFIVTDLSTVIK